MQDCKPLLPLDQVTFSLSPVGQCEYENRKPCTIEGCDRPRRARGYCRAHYHRALRALKRQQREATGGPR